MGVQLRMLCDLVDTGCEEGDFKLGTMLGSLGQLSGPVFA